MKIIKEINGDAIVEATILFPIMIMVFAALVMLSIYLPVRAALQHATQYAATVIAVECSDTWLFFDENDMEYQWEIKDYRLYELYIALFSEVADVDTRSETIVREIESRGISSKAGTLSVDGYVVNKIIYKEIVVTATREIEIPLKLPIIGFPESMSVTATSTAVVQNAEEVVRNIDLAVDFADFISEKFGLSSITEVFGAFSGKAASFLGW